MTVDSVISGLQKKLLDVKSTAQGQQNNKIHSSNNQSNVQTALKRFSSIKKEPSLEILQENHQLKQEEDKPIQVRLYSVTLEKPLKPLKFVKTTIYQYPRQIQSIMYFPKSTEKCRKFQKFLILFKQ